jgi:hypothetical protein
VFGGFDVEVDLAHRAARVDQESVAGGEFGYTTEPYSVEQEAPSDDAGGDDEP